MQINKNLVHQVGDQTKVIFYKYLVGMIITQAHMHAHTHTHTHASA